MIDPAIKHFLCELQQLASSEFIPCIGGRSELPTQPGLKVKGRPISLPVAHEDLEWLCQEGCESPFGKGYETVLDTDIRRSIEFEAQDIEILNPSWESELEKLTASISAQMAIDFQIKAELFKLLVYREGGHFKFHQDTEKAQGMFASLIVQLPSRHRGGALICRFAEQEFCFEFGHKKADSEFNIYYAAHYADVQHQVEKVEEGARLVLVYNLIQPLTERQLSANLHEQILETTQGMVPQIFSSLEQEQHAFLLQHEYTEQSLSELGFSAVKGQDRSLVKALLAVNDKLALEHKLYFLISRLSYSVTSQGCGYGNEYDNEYDDDDWEEIDSTSPSFDLCFDQEGHLLPINDLGIDRIHDLNSQDINSFAFDTIDDHFWGEGDDEIEGFMGNYGPTKETTYARYLLTIMPAYPANADAFSNDIVLLAHRVLLMAQDLRLHPNYDWLKTRYNLALKQLLTQFNIEQQNQSTHQWNRYFNDKELAIFTCLLKIAIASDEYELCQTAIETVSNRIAATLSSEVRAKEVLSLLIGAIEYFGWKKLSPLLNPVLNELDGDAVLRTSTSLAENKEDRELRAELMDICVNNICREQGSWEYHNRFKKTVLPLAVNLCMADWYATTDARNLFFTTCLEKSVNQPPLLTALIQNLIKDTQANNKKEWLKTLITARLEYLEGVLSKEPKPFSWSMPHANVRKNNIAAFLLGENQQAQIIGYDGIAMARLDVISVDSKWILPEFYMESHADFQLPESNYGFSATMQAKGRGKQSYIQIEKDKRYDELTIKLRKLREQEFETLKNVYSNLTEYHVFLP